MTSGVAAIPHCGVSQRLQRSCGMPNPLVLVVDDDPLLRLMVAEFLGLSGLRVATASNGVEGLKAIIAEEPSLVLLDWRMPVLDGRGFAHGLRQLGRPIPIALVTGEPNYA